MVSTCTTNFYTLGPPIESKVSNLFVFFCIGGTGTASTAAPRRRLRLGHLASHTSALFLFYFYIHTLVRESGAPCVCYLSHFTPPNGW